jgi:cell division protein FtsI/penicillin-binding protein 2
MISNILTKIFGSRNERLLKQYSHALQKINAFEPAIAAKSDAELKAMLTNVVDEHGATGNAAQIAGYTVAGKTGTAQKPGPNGYTTGKYVASFVGMVPVSKPRLVVLVTVDEPHGSIFGGEVAAPAFAQIAKFDLQYLEVQPDAPLTPSQ